ncbi:MAG: polymer-forming cytoskeletal protein [Burkholderiaceae bacterium]|nr:polymer-forming cytoskeletal protein [Burkholderiaceae bacterium]
MLKSDTLFGKRENAIPLPQNGATGRPPLGQGNSLAASLTESAKHTAGSQPATAQATSAADTSGSKLIVGPNIKLKGVEITDCDTIVVEGLVEATIYAREIQIDGPGAFKGAAHVDSGEIHGEFDGDLTVAQKLTIFSNGKVSGKIRYGKLVIEEGGQLSGDVQMDVSGKSGKPPMTS